ncbi:conserved hypothetical protein [methanotrophic bacterial endosymbiont of Bathymodiolus sp.]|nr:conserved hypothetical protein [methanotrophic bacterial endosymbiont of Bathymodiolus sp.]
MGVFPCYTTPFKKLNSLPHARGGVSTFGNIKLNRPMSSPRPWGCFKLKVAQKKLLNVFPTPVGVFLC